MKSLSCIFARIWDELEPQRGATFNLNIGETA